MKLMYDKHNHRFFFALPKVVKDSLSLNPNKIYVVEFLYMDSLNNEIKVKIKEVKP